MNLYAWNFWEYVVYTITENPQPGDYIYKDTGVAYEYEEYHYNFINDWYYSNIIETVQTGATPKIGIRANKDRPEEQVVEFERNPSGDLEVEGGVEPENLVSKFVHNGVTYTIKDAQAREDIANKQDKLSSTNVLTTGSGNVIDGISASDGIITATKNTTLSTVATSGSYSDLSNKPTIPTVNDATISFTQGGVNKGSFTLNQSSGTTIALDAGGADPLPSQTGQSGKFLTTNGTTASWAEVQSGGSSTINTVTKTLTANSTTVNTEVDLSNSVILNVYISGIYQIPTTHYSMSTSNNETTITFTSSYNQNVDVTVVYATSVGLTNLSYTDLINRPKILNVVENGSLTRNGTVFSGFSSSNYLRLGDKVNGGYYFSNTIKNCSVLSSNDYIEIIVKFTTSNDIASFQNIVGWLTTCDLYVENNYLKIWSESQDTYITCGEVSTNSTYWCKVILDNTTKTISYSTDGTNYIGEQSIQDTNTFDTICKLGMSGATGSDAPNRYFRGSIDINETYIKSNNEIWWKGVETL